MARYPEDESPEDEFEGASSDEKEEWPDLDEDVRRAAEIAQGEALPDPGGDIGAGAD